MKKIQVLCKALFWVGVVLLFTGLAISFVPGAEVFWFATVAVLLALGLFTGRKRYQIPAILLASWAVWAAVDGHRRGLEYRQFEAHRTEHEAWATKTTTNQTAEPHTGAYRR